MQRTLLASVCVVGLLSHGFRLFGSPRTVDDIRGFGYDAEEHTVVTEDGYILSMTHIKSFGKKTPVLMVHGLLGASDQWIIRGRGKDLALILVDQGHDVWLTNQRGNHHSRKHKFLNTSSEEFWDFSFHEMGLYDIPAFIKKVLQHSNLRQLHYIGHSMGTTVYYVMCSLRPEYNQLIRTAVHLSPIAYAPFKDLSPTLSMLMHSADIIAAVFKMMKIYEILPKSTMNELLIDFWCSELNEKLCLFVVSELFGPEKVFTKTTKLKEYLKKLQSGTSTKTIIHLVQLFTSRNFSRFDYGKDKNLKVYQTEFPPAYPLQKVTSRIALFYSDNDVFIDNHSMNRLKSILPNVIASTSIPEYNHIDLLFADSTPTLLYKKVAKLLNKS